ncbi:unnamed protein product, partial [Effrenium voratum]
RKTLFHAYSFWFASPHARCQAQKKHLFRSSVQTNGFDMFLSHTWNTQGGWKFLSLFLQFGWPTILCCWAFGVILGFALCMLNILPLFELCHHTALGFTGVIPSSCWIQIFGLLGILLGCLLFPHLPFCKKDKCFLDFACINQTDETKMAEGIMSISAFLVASKELRVLWSPPLLSRLWCVFEIAAYRKLNPTGKIVIAPVDNEKSACMLLLWWQISCLAYWKARAGPEGGNPTALLVVGASFFLVLIPAAGHALWQSQKSSNQLRSDLANFDVTQVSCSSDFDRECIHGAITTWYGTLEAFSAHMRGPFSQEVLELMRMSGSIASQYIYLSMTPGVCLSLDKVLALVKAGAPAQPVLSVFFSHVVSLNLLYFPAVHLLEFAFQPQDVVNALNSANEWSPPPPPAKSNQYEGSFQLLGVRALHLEASVQPLMTRHGDVECALFLELRLGQVLPESTWAHVLVWCGLEAFPGDNRGSAEPDEPMAAMQLRLPKGCVCSSLQRVACGSLLQQA